MKPGTLRFHFPVLFALTFLTIFVGGCGKAPEPTPKPEATSGDSGQGPLPSKSDVQIAHVTDVPSRLLVEDRIAADRTLSQPLVPVGEVSLEEDAALQEALAKFALVAGKSDFSALEAFLREFPNGARSHALRNNLAELYYGVGRFSDSYAMWEDAWKRSSKVDSEWGHLVADAAFAGYSRLAILFGRKETLGPLLDEVETRPMTGAADEYRRLAYEAFEAMNRWEDQAFKCGPFALFRVRYHAGISDPLHPLIKEEKSTIQGTNMARLAELSEELGMPMQVVRNPDPNAIPTPSVVYWKLGHYSAVVGRDENGHYIVEDTTFANPIHITPEVMQAESAGYYLVRKEQVNSSFSLASVEESSKLWGRMSPPQRDSDDLGPENPEKPGCGMPVWSVGKLNISLRVTDTPLSYSTAFGPAVSFMLNYNARDLTQPTVFNFSNVGRQWTFNWQQYIEDNPAQPLANVKRKRVAGGRETYSGYDSGTGYYGLQPRSVTRLQKVADAHYVLHHPDGSREVFSLSDGAASGNRRVFLTAQIDPNGNTVSFAYDTTKRLVAITDAAGLETTIHYADTNSPFRITSVTDPHGRSAVLTYNASGLLASITDQIGMTSSFLYASGDEMASMTTPYGKTTFDASGSYQFERGITITEPDGGRERFEFRDFYGTGNLIPNSPSPEETVDPEVNVANIGYANRTTFHWDRKAMKNFPGDYSKADHYHWLDTSSSSYVVSGVVKAFRQPGRRLIFYLYPGQYSNESAGTLDRPSVIAVRDPSGAVRKETFEYNAAGLVTKRIDPLGRETVFEYASDGISLDRVKQKNGSSHDLLSEVVTRDAAMRPIAVLDAAGETTGYTYNARGQLLTVTDPLNRVTSITYGENSALPSFGRPVTFTGVVSGQVTTISYDAVGRPANITAPDGYTVAMTYDNFDRLVETDFPDGTNSTNEYDRLDLVRTIDREKKEWVSDYNEIRQLRWTRDPLGRLVSYEYCSCGKVKKLTDAEGRETRWQWGLNGENTAKILPDGRTWTNTYDVLGQLSTVTDPLGQVTTLTYHLDGANASVAYSNAVNATPGATYAYDPIYPRLSSTTGAFGTTNYSYVAPGTLGAEAVASIDGPWDDDTVTWTYDELGRTTGSTLYRAGGAISYDTQGRVASLTDVLGTTSFTYDGVTSRILETTRLDGLESLFSYTSVAQGSKLTGITHSHDVTGTISSFGYGHSPEGRITEWTRMVRPGATTDRFEFAYDSAGRLTDALLKNVSTGALLETFSYRYDKAGNRLTGQRGESVVGGVFNESNQLTGVSGGGVIAIRGQVDQPVTSITVDGEPAALNGSGGFVGSAEVETGLNRIPIVVTEPDTTTTQKYAEMTVAATEAQVREYDLNGNLVGIAAAAAPADLIRSFEWDAADRLIAINQFDPPGSVTPAKRSEFGYNESSQRVEAKEYEDGNLVSHQRFLWSGARLHQVRDASGDEVLVTFTGSGEADYVAGSGGVPVKRHYLVDHLGSIRNVVDEAGGEIVSYDYDPYGVREKIFAAVGSGGYEASPGYTGHWHHFASGLVLTYYRGYEPETGRWLSPDPLGEAGGLNLYGYVGGDPANFLDSEGLAPKSVTIGLGAGGAFIIRFNWDTETGMFGVDGGVGIGIGGQIEYDSEENCECPSVTDGAGSKGNFGLEGFYSTGVGVMGFGVGGRLGGEAAYHGGYLTGRLEPNQTSTTSYHEAYRKAGLRGVGDLGTNIKNRYETGFPVGGGDPVYTECEKYSQSFGIGSMGFLGLSGGVSVVD